jgi:nucleoside-diphosphate-sugar epimerase
MEPRVLVTGATGFVGRHVVVTLARDGRAVRALVRRGGDFAENVEVATSPDILDRESIRAAVAGVTTIVHLAGRAHAKPEGKNDPASECRRINVEGTALLLEEAAAAGVQRFILASSVKAVASDSSVALTPDTPPQPGDAYGESKLEAERLVKVVSARSGIHAVILRLPVIYGPGMKANMAALFGAVDRGFPLPLASVRNRRSFAYVGNVGAAVASLLDETRGPANVAYVSDEHDLSTPDLVRQIGTALGRKPRLFAFPPAMLAGAGAAGGLLSRIAGLHFSTESVTAVLGSLFVDTSSLREMTGFKPPFSLGQGMSLTAAGYRSAKAG